MSRRLPGEFHGLARGDRHERSSASQPRISGGIPNAKQASKYTYGIAATAGTDLETGADT